MENASKALIIAGAILISIVLITLGIVILGQGQDTVNSSNMDAETMSAWNDKFDQYAGVNISGTKVNKLLEAVLTNNQISDRDGNTDRLINVDATDVGTDIAKNGSDGGYEKKWMDEYSKVKPGAQFTVTTEKHGGIITKITIKKASSKS